MSPVADVLAKLLVCAVFTASHVSCNADGPLPWEWPLKYEHLSSRPPPIPSCQSGSVPFCPTGRQHNSVPLVEPSDHLYVYIMSAPAWDYGSLLDKHHIMDYAMGFHHVQSGANFTMEWYEMYDLFNSSFPSVQTNHTLLWCNQGATCMYDGIHKDYWQRNGTLNKVADITGDTFRQFAAWTEDDNNSAVYYQTWMVKQQSGNDGKTWINPWEGSSWVERAFLQLVEMGASFNNVLHLHSVHPTIYSQQPIELGTAASIFTANTTDDKVAENIINFYSAMEAYATLPDLLEAFDSNFTGVVPDGVFYLFYNHKFWAMKTVPPYFEFIPEEFKLP